MASDDGQGAPPSGGDSSDDDAWFDGFMDRIDQMEQKLAKIPEDIGEKLDTIMGQTSGQSNAQPSPAPQPARPPRPAASPTSQRSVPSAAPPVQTPSKDQQPRVRHWYFGERPGKRNG